MNQNQKFYLCHKIKFFLFFFFFSFNACDKHWGILLVYRRAEASLGYKSFYRLRNLFLIDWKMQWLCWNRSEFLK